MPGSNQANQYQPFSAKRTVCVPSGRSRYANLGAPMPKEKLTDRFVSTIKCEVQTDYFDTLEPGLALRVSPTRKTWSIMYTRPGSRQRVRFTIGEFSVDFGLAKARKTARALKADIAAGKDPQADKVLKAEADAAALTMKELVEDYIKRHVSGLRSGDEVTRRLRRNILDKESGLGAVKAQDLHRRDIVKAVDAVADRGAKTEAARCFEDIRAVVKWAVGRGVLDRDATAGMKAPQRGGARDRVLSKDEIPVLFKALPDSGMRDMVQDIVRLLFETACRISEIAGLSVKEVDLKDKLLRLPPERVKNGLAHNVPLTDEAMAILSRLVKGKKGFVFPVGDGPIRGDVVANELSKAQKSKADKPALMPVAGWTAHDVRRTWATIASELGIPPHIIAAALNHQSVNSGVTFAHYVRNDFMPERRAAHEAVSGHIAKLTISAS
ncbi:MULTISPECIES: tyrosine-type recombinase/integrase [unclassified Mesorhizobium]|uniref:tyrosine-type recombinase/integrase n=1 Tax=unclassified Mesorhizobium TaxID=325217 RepID=UPI0030144B89